jgi:hypothetical protein
MKSSRWSMAVVAWLTASLCASPYGVAAAPQQATPPALPPDTVNQAGLQWNLFSIGRGEATKPFRFSLCEGRYLAPGELSRPCNQFTHPRTVDYGHDAPFVFSAGHNRFLPPGLSIDGNGILQGDDPALLSELDELPLCVRQLDVEMCKPIRILEKTLIREDPIAKPLDNGAGPPKKGMGAAKAVVLAGGLGLAAGGIALAASAANLADPGSSGGSNGMSLVSAQGILCLYNAGGVLSNCSANVLVNITGGIPVGSTLRLQGSFWAGNRTTSTSPPGSINFYLTGGTGGTSCPGPLTSLDLLNLSQSTSVIIASAGGFAIPVTCR